MQNNLIMKKIVLGIVITLSFTVYFIGVKSYSLLKTSYISKIEYDKEKTKEIKNILKNFNDKSDKEIIRYRGFRPISIMEDKELKKQGYVGLATVSLTECEIRLSDTIKKEDFREVLLHEYMHCFFYEHKNIPGDLMYRSIDFKATERSINYYAHNLGIIFGTVK